jgi:hypothetical protein
MDGLTQILPCALAISLLACARPAERTAPALAQAADPPVLHTTEAAAGNVSPGPEPQSVEPVLVELFTSEGCSSCPAAERALGRLVATPPLGLRVIPLEFHVDYWDYLGHRDPFGSSAFAARQHNYAQRLHLRPVYTPQAVVDGRTELVGSRGEELSDALRQAAKRPHAKVRVVQTSGAPLRVTVDVGPLPLPTDRAFLTLAEVIEEPTNKVARGENAGKNLEHTWVVAKLHELGQVEEKGSMVQSPVLTGSKAHRVVAFVTRANDGAVLGAETLALRP